jgi:hypothetical protein
MPRDLAMRRSEALEKRTAPIDESRGLLLQFFRVKS